MTEQIKSNHEVPPHERRPPRGLRPVLPGLLILTLGIVFLLDNLDFVESGRILRFWPVILVVAGVKHLWEARDRGKAFMGAVLAGAGGLLLLESLNIIDFDVWDLWPLILVAVGFRMLAFPRSPFPASQDGTDAVENCSAFLGSVERRNRSADFQGGSASAFLGGVNLDLTGADMAGDRAVLRVSAMMGGIEIRIPEEWTTEVRLTPLLGGVEDKTRGPAAATKRLVLEGAVLMGGVEIRN